MHSIPLPEPDQPAKAISDQLAQRIQQEIAQHHGKITFARFMELALYAPGLGYYSAGSHKFGKHGDFVTAPQISPLFAECIAHQCAEIFKLLPASDMLELGAGSGLFAKNLLESLAALDQLPNHYYILEISADLRERQETLLKTLPHSIFSRIIWLDRLPEKLSGIIFANEVLDAMPVHSFIIENGIKERYVTANFDWTIADPSNVMLIEKISPLKLPEGYQSEINLLLPAWIKSISESLKQGVFLMLDYGYSKKEYYHPDRSMGTLMCHYQHHRHDNPFIFPGLQDITAHVDFTAVVESALNAGFSLSGYTTQAAFLMALNILQIAEEKPGDTIEKYQQNQALKTLLLPSEMGEIIKVMALAKDFDHALTGFNLQNRMRDL